jgi:hypothetical protein
VVLRVENRVQQANERQTMAWRGDERSRIRWMMWRRTENKRVSKKSATKVRKNFLWYGSGLKIA